MYSSDFQFPKTPLPFDQIDRQVLHHTEHPHAQVGHGQVRQEEVGDGAQPAGHRYHQYHQQVAWKRKLREKRKWDDKFSGTMKSGNRKRAANVRNGH